MTGDDKDKSFGDCTSSGSFLASLMLLESGGRMLDDPLVKDGTAGSLLRPCRELMSEVRGCCMCAVPSRRGLTLRRKSKPALAELLMVLGATGALVMGGGRRLGGDVGSVVTDGG